MIDRVKVLQAVRSLGGRRFMVGDICETLGVVNTRKRAGEDKKGPTPDADRIAKVVRALRAIGILGEHKRGVYCILDAKKLDGYIQTNNAPRITHGGNVAFDKDDKSALPVSAEMYTLLHPAGRPNHEYTIDDVKRVVVDAASKITVAVVVEILRATAACDKAAQVPPERFSAVIDAINWRVELSERAIREREAQRKAVEEAAKLKMPVAHEELRKMMTELREDIASACRTVSDRQHKFEHVATQAVGFVRRDLKPLTEMVEAADKTFKEVLSKQNTIHAKLEAQQKSLQDLRARVADLELKHHPDPAEQEIAHARLHDSRYTPEEQHTIMNGRGGY